MESSLEVMILICISYKALILAHCIRFRLLDWPWGFRNSKINSQPSLPITMAIAGLIHADCDWFDNSHSTAFTFMLTLLLGEVRLSETTFVQLIHTYCHITLFSLTIQMELEGVQSMLDSKIHRPLLLPLPCDKPSEVLCNSSSPGQTTLAFHHYSWCCFSGPPLPCLFPSGSVSFSSCFSENRSQNWMMLPCSSVIAFLLLLSFHLVCFPFIPKLKWH